MPRLYKHIGNIKTSAQYQWNIYYRTNGDNREFSTSKLDFDNSIFLIDDKHIDRKEWDSNVRHSLCLSSSVKILFIKRQPSKNQNQ